jgi:F0F1-type ATP synthase assembly protein I
MPSRIARRVITWQVGVGVVGAVVWLVVGDTRHALAALAGGGIAAILSLHTALRLKVRPGGTPSPATALGAFLWAEIVKLVLAIGLLLVAAQVFRDAYVAVVTVFGAALAVYVIALRWPD